jgi:hypothetical protein
LRSQVEKGKAMRIKGFTICSGLAGIAAAAAIAAAPSAFAADNPSGPANQTPSVSSPGGAVALPAGGPVVIIPEPQNIGGANPYVPFGTDPYVPWGVWSQ